MTPGTFQSVSRRFGIALAMAGTLLAPLAARASTAANTSITNTATVNYNDAGGNAQAAVSASSTVTVTLVPAAVTLSSPPNQTISQGTSATLVYTITSNANGPDTYNLSSTATPTNDSAVTPTLPASISLGGTTLAAVANTGDASITVPYDGVAGSTVNGIGAGSTIVIGGNAYTVAAAGVTKNAAANTATITLTTTISGGPIAAGTIVGERKTFTETVPSGTITSGSSGTQTVSTTATSGTAPNPATTQSTPTVITVNRPTLTVAKTVSTDGGNTFGATASAPPGTILTYKVIATNTGSTNASSVQFTDALPKYVTYQTNSGRYATADTAYGSATAVSDGSGGYSYTAATTTINYNPGGATGTVAGGGALVLFYQVKIN